MGKRYSSVKGITRVQSIAIAIVIIIVIGVAAYFLLMPALIPQEKRVLTKAEISELFTIDPYEETSVEGVSVSINTYDTLVIPKYDREKGKVMILPHLATDWSASPDGLTYTFHLRKGVKFHDGSELKAEDVAFSMDRMLILKRGWASFWLGTVSPGTTKTLDDYTVQFNLDKPYVPFVASMMRLQIMNKDQIMGHEEAGDYGKKWLDEGNDAGSGPYKIAKWERGVEVVCTRFDDYFLGWGPNPIDEIHFKYVPEEATQKMMVMKGDGAVVLSHWLDYSVYEDLMEQPGVVCEVDAWAVIAYITLNNKRPPFDDIHVRKAVRAAIDYDGLFELVYMGYAERLKGANLDSLLEHYPDLVNPGYDLTLAKEELKKSKYSPEELSDMVIKAWVMTGNLKQERAQLFIRDCLEKIGLRVELEPLTTAKLYGELCTKPETTPHTCFFSTTEKFPDPDVYVTWMFHPSAQGTLYGMNWYENATVTQLAEEARVELDPDRRVKLYQEIERLLIEDCASVFLAQPKRITPHTANLYGWEGDELPMGFQTWVYKLTMD